LVEAAASELRRIREQVAKGIVFSGEGE